MKNAVAYLRVSGKSQIDGDGFPRQRDRITKWAKANKHQVVGEFCDEGISGTSELSDRPGLAALLDRIESIFTQRHQALFIAFTHYPHQSLLQTNFRQP